MSTILVKGHTGKDHQEGSTTSLDTAAPLGFPLEEKRFFFQRTGAYNPDAIATQVYMPRYTTLTCALLSKHSPAFSMTLIQP